MKLEFTGERYVPGEQGEIRLEHMHRYCLALEWASGKRVLDVACGEGYGTRLLATVAEAVEGVDISPDTVAHARTAYAAVANVNFREASATSLPFEPSTFDLVVSFETIEHLAEQAEMLAEIRRVLKPGGLLVISSPNRPVYSREGEFRNEFHVKELDLAELDALLRPVFPAIRYLGQRITAGSIVQPLEDNPQPLQAWSDDGEKLAPGLPSHEAPVYFIALCAASEASLPHFQASFVQPLHDDLLERYRDHARWAVRADQELERVRGLFAGMQAEHEKVAAWAKDLDRLAAERLEAIAAGETKASSLDEELTRLRAAHEQALARLDETLRAARVDLQQAAIEKEPLEQAIRALGEALARSRADATTATGRADAAETKATTSEARANAAEAAATASEARANAAEAEATASEARANAAESSAAAMAADRDAHAAHAANLQGLANHQQAQLSAYANSLSWRITAPLRLVAAIALTTARAGFRLALQAVLWIGRTVLRLAVASEFDRRKLRGAAFGRYPALFRGSAVLAAWQARQPQIAALAARLSTGDPAQLGNLVSRNDTGRRPRVSVIIPIYGQLDYTLRCLQSTLDVKSRAAFELIVVDDSSPDESVEALAALPAIRFVGNDSNQGFIRTCNRGAQVARGDFLFFLNNDTVVQEGWLDELLITFDDVPECGLAGSMLLYPDGRLQEAGGIIWNDGSGWNYGRLDDPFKPEYSYRRDVDYCSGASLMVRADLFAKLGGFDEHYAPAYCEDSDLAFRVRQAGHRVLYQPRSRVIHYEGITSGTDLSQGAKAHQVANARKLFERWKDVLASHGAPGGNPHLARDRNIAGRVLVIDHCTPTPDQDAGSITALNLMRILQAQGMKVTFVPEDNMLYLLRYTTEMERMGIECLYEPHVGSLRSHLAKSGHVYDAIVFFRVENAKRHLDEIELYCPQAKIVFHTSDLHFLRTQRQAEVEGSDALRSHAAVLKDMELGTMRRTHATIVHSSAEKQLLDGMLGWQGASRIFVMGWAIPVPGTKAPFRERDGIVFVGGYQHTPNVDGVDFFVKDIFPAIRRRLPAARFLIVGSKAPDRFKSFGVPGVEFVGFVMDLGELFDRCRLSVAPLRFGAGTKGKIYTSLSHGLPCVSTTIGAEGMDLTDGENVLVADDPDDFAQKVVRLHEDEALWNRLSASGYRFLEKHASMEAGRAVVDSLLEHIGLSGRARVVSQPAAGPVVSGEVIVRDRRDYETFVASDLAHRQRRQEERILLRNAVAAEAFDLDGWCEVCAGRTAFRVDKLWGGTTREDGTWLPNWRERCLCACCRLNTRQRVVAARVRDFVRSRAPGPVNVYLTEQVTPIFHWLVHSVPGAHWVGSEYLGPDVIRGSVNEAGLRHEDVERLSFADGSFDLVVSNDVLEHVVDPDRAFAEILRVLRPGGFLFLTVPFHTDLATGRRRARLAGGELVHELPPEYHGNPVSSEGSLVFTDFGWDMLDRMRELGFAGVEMRLYWAETNGYLGVGQHYLVAGKPA